MQSLNYRSLGAISELQVDEVLTANKHVTVGFDATTQEGTHVNEINFTTGNEWLSAAVDELRYYWTPPFVLRT